jgi:hypothetical protein
MMDVSKRIESLEAISAIKDLKFKYWKACDAKKPIAVLKCFHPDKVEIDFEDFGIFIQPRIWLINIKLTRVTII